MCTSLLGAHQHLPGWLRSHLLHCGCNSDKPSACTHALATPPTHHHCREGINIFLAGFVPTENLRFREESLSFKVVEQIVGDDELKKFSRYSYPTMSKTQGNFKLQV